MNLSQNLSASLLHVSMGRKSVEDGDSTILCLEHEVAPSAIRKLHFHP